MSLTTPMTAVALGATLLIVIGLVVSIVRSTGARKASRRQPVCAACGYLMAGWRSSACPECGRDVREAGVAGQVLDRTWRMQAIICGILTALVLGWLSLVGINQFVGRLETRTDWRLGPSSILERFIVASRRAGVPVSETWTLRPVDLAVDPGAVEAGELLRHLELIDGGKTWSEVDLPFIEAVIAWMPRAAPPYPVSSKRTVSLGSVSIRTSPTPRWAYALAGIAVVIGYLVGAYLGGRRFGVGWRIPTDGEWRRAGETAGD